MIFEALSKIKRNAIFSAILLFAAGIIILICPNDYFPIIIMGLGYALVIIALIMVFGFFASNKSLMAYVKFIAALFLGVGGVCVLIIQQDTLKMLAWLFGFLLIIDGLRTLIHSFTYARRSHRKAWWVLTILSFFLMVAGVMLFINPWFATLDSLKRIIGGALIFSSMISLLRLIWTWPLKKEKAQEAVKEEEREAIEEKEVTENV